MESIMYISGSAKCRHFAKWHHKTTLRHNIHTIVKEQYRATIGYKTPEERMHSLATNLWNLSVKNKYEIRKEPFNSLSENKNGQFISLSFYTHSRHIQAHNRLQTIINLQYCLSKARRTAPFLNAKLQAVDTNLKVAGLFLCNPSDKEHSSQISEL